MIEPWLQATCDVCGETDWSGPNETLLEFKQGAHKGWKHERQRSMCIACQKRGASWAQATLHERVNA
jgi:hypothetical protein